MDTKKYLTMNSDELYEHLISDILSDPAEGFKILEELSQMNRFFEDHEFRAYVETCQGMLHMVSGNLEKVSSICTELIERTAALNLWSLSALNWNLLGNAYCVTESFERALECYHNTIKVEVQHNLNTSQPLAYHNIALIYLNLEQFEKSAEYFKLSIDTLIRTGENQPRFVSRYVTFTSDLIVAYLQIEKIEEAEVLFEAIKKCDASKFLPGTVYAIELAYMYYYFHIHDFEKGRAAYYKSRGLIEKENSNNHISLLSAYLELCSKFNLEREFYINELLSVEELERSNAPLSHYYVYKELRAFYKDKGDRESLDRASDKFIEILLSEARSVRKLQNHSLQLIERLLVNNEELSDITSSNAELRLLANEAIRNKNALEEANNRLAVINEIGRKLTSSLNLSEVTDLIYNNIKVSIPVDFFVIMLVDRENYRLRSVTAHFENVLYPEFYLNLDREESLFVKCFHENEIICSDQVQGKLRHIRVNFPEVKEKKEMHSGIFMPLSVSGEIIGVCSVQSSEKQVYTKAHMDFLRDLLPYLSIALNNALHSWRLEREIQSHLRTQEKLEIANRRLEFISSLDSLTQISNRKDFDYKFKEMLQLSEKFAQPISVYMTDIDDFKLYNDTYGHLAGDEALKSVAKILRENIDKVGGISARFGGEEFIAACIGLDLKDSVRLAEKIRQDVLKLGIEHHVIDLKKLSISIGVAITQQAVPKQKSELMRNADVSLYEAKNSGKNKVVFKEVFL